MRKFILILLLCLTLASCQTGGQNETDPPEFDAGISRNLVKIADAKGIPIVSETVDDPVSEDETVGYIVINTSSKKIHTNADCSYAKTIKESNKLTDTADSVSDYLESGYTICSSCAKNSAQGGE